MPDIDDRLQRYLSQIEAGVPRDKVLASLKEGEQELAALIKLADAMRTISHPMPAPAFSRAARQKILAAVPQTRPQPRPANNPFGWLAFPSLTGAAAILLVVFISVAAFGIWRAGPARAETASIQNIEGVVERAPTANSEDWAVLGESETVRSGERIRTAPGSGATLVFMDGSHLRMSPESTIVLNKVDGSWGGDIQVDINQSLGQAAYDVVPFHSDAAYFRVNTPAGLASVHGTSFTVFVEADGASRVVVESGEVAVSNIDQQVFVPAGQATVVQPGKAPEEPGNFFDIVDVVVSIENTQWAVTGQSFQVNSQTHILGAPQVGHLLQIQGRILGNSQWVADLIQPLDDTIRSSFTGIVENISAQNWLVSNKEIMVNAVTQVQDQLRVGIAVEVTYLALGDGRWLALQINALGTTSDSESTPETELSTTAVETLTNTIPAQANPVTCDLGDQQPAAQALATKLGASYADIAGWFCQGYSFDEIELAFNLKAQTGHEVAEIFGYRSANMDWEEIFALLMLQTNASGSSNKICQGDGYHPKILQLANKYGVTDEEIMALYCEGYSFNEIDLAYSLSKEYKKDIKDILKGYSEAKNWGQLKKELGEQAVREANPNKPDNNPSKNPNSDGSNKGGNSDPDAKPTKDK